jgi:hypothetical protein
MIVVVLPHYHVMMAFARVNPMKVTIEPLFGGDFDLTPTGLLFGTKITFSAAPVGFIRRRFSGVSHLSKSGFSIALPITVPQYMVPM